MIVTVFLYTSISLLPLAGNKPREEFFMTFFNDYICFGISPSMLYPLSFEDELEHFSAVDQCCQLPEYECF